jgi:hypothetical protein
MNKYLSLMFILFLLFFLCQLSVNGQLIPQEAINVSEKINKNAIRAHMRFLADDLLEGREPFTKGYRLAAQYVASQFEEIGLKPGVGDSAYFQNVQIFKNKSTVTGSLAINYNGEIESLIHGEDFFLISEPGTIESNEKKLVFGGIGVQDPSLGYRDLEKLNVKDKYVILYYQHPRDRSLLLSLKHMKDQRLLELKSAGAAGVIYYFGKKDQEAFSWDMLKYYLSRENYKVTYMDFPLIFIDWNIINTLLDQSGLSPAEYTNGNALPYQFKIKASLKPDIEIEQDFEIVESPNVLGYIKGSDPILKNEYIIYTAHLDHVGIGRAIEGDSIYNGAYDNTSGTAIMLEIARAYRQLKVPPKRSVLFISFTAEEIGLLGSEYFVNHPTVDLNNMVASLNMDMFLMEKPLKEIVALGEELSGLGNLVRQVCDHFTVAVIPDPLPEENAFMRSDHINFVRKGIPSLFLINSFQKSETIDENTDANYRWLKTIYHSPLDNFRENINYNAGVTYGKINFLTGYLAAEQQEKIQWKFDFTVTD